MRAYVHITGVIFGIVTLAHVLRLIMGWPIQLAGLVIPVWMSWPGILLAGTLCVWAFRLVGRARE
jgi:hypothetical protein